MVKINGEETSYDEKTITEVLEMMNLKPEAVAVEVNLSIVPKDKYGTTVLKDGDKAEVVRFVGGG